MSLKFNLLPKVISSAIFRRLSTSSVKQQQSVGTNKLVQIDVNDKTGYATLSLNRLPANSLNIELMDALTDAMDQLEKNKTKGVVLTSNSPKIFSAGLDIDCLYNADSKKLAELWSSSQESWLKLYDSSIPVCAAINGHAIGGGCFFAMSCDYRAMVSGYKIGLNEIQVGVAPPRILMMLMGKLLPRRQAEISLTQGILYTPEVAQRIKLIDEVASDKADAIAKCVSFLNIFTKISAEARNESRRKIRKDEIEYMRNNKAKDIEEFVKSVESVEAQNTIKIYYEALKNKK